MAINQPNIKKQVSALIAANKNLDPEQAEDAFAEGIANIITQALLSATVSVTIPSGVVSQGVTPSVIVNPAPIPLTGNLS